MQKFIFSYNTVVKGHVDPAAGKIVRGGNFSAFNENWVPDERDINTIKDYVASGAGLCAWHMVNNKRVKRNTGCISAGLVILDIDNQADHKGTAGEKIQQQELSVEDSKELPLCKKYLSFSYKSPSHTEAWPRFRLVFGLAKPIIDPDFYQWFTRKLAKSVPGSDVRATQVPNLFYGCKDPSDVICVTDKYIPADYIDSAYLEYSAVAAKASNEGGDPSVILKQPTDPKGIDLNSLVSRKVRDLLNGDQPDDRSTAMAVAFKELIGWVNWLKQNNVPIATDPLDIAHTVFYNIYQYDPEVDGKFNRILNSIKEPGSIEPSVLLASEDGQGAAWRKVRRANRDLYETLCPQETKDALQYKKPTPKDSVLVMDFEDPAPQPKPPTATKTTPTPKPTPKPTMPASTPQSAAQLVQVQLNKKTFSENDIAEIFAQNFKEEYLFDSKLDEFFAYDKQEGVWYLNDEHHTKRRITKVLDTFVTSGVLDKYNSATVNSIYSLLKAKLLRSNRGGRQSIWQSSRGKIPFNNGVVDATSIKFEEGNHRDYYFQTKLAFDYSTKNKCPEMLKWLEWAVGKDKIILIRAFCRAVLTGYTTGEKFLHLIGPGGSGKSTLQQILIALAGYTGTHTSDLETIETNRFECHSLIGKRLLLLTDEASFSRRLDTLKKLTSSSDTLRAERKYGKEVINFKPELLVSIASNEHISSSDISSGLERRRLTIVMDKVIDPSQRRNLISVYSDRIEGEFVKELPGFATWLLEMPYADMKDVLANPAKHCPNITATNLDALVFNNPICAFLADCCMYAPNSYTPLGNGAFRPSVDESEKGYFTKNAYTEVYSSYVNYCRSNGYKHAAKARFVDRLKETTSHVVKIPGIGVRYKEGRAVVTGIRLKPYDATTDRAAYGPDRLPTPIEWAENPTIWDKAFQKHDTPSSPNPQ